MLLNAVDVYSNLVDIYFSEYVDVHCKTCPLTVDTWIRKFGSCEPSNLLKTQKTNIERCVSIFNLILAI